jgi:hypothetical protein
MGFAEGFGKLCFYTGIFAAGYMTHSCVGEDQRYDIRRYSEKPYLVDKTLGERVEIKYENEKLQLGDLEYRVECILEDHKFEDHIESLKGRLRK